MGPTLSVEERNEDFIEIEIDYILQTGRTEATGAPVVSQLESLGDISCQINIQEKLKNFNRRVSHMF